MLPDDLTLVRVARTDLPALAWAEGETFCVPRVLADRAGAGAPVEGVRPLHVRPGLKPSGDEVDGLRTRAAFTDRKPVSSRLPVSYRWFPARARKWVGTRIGKRKAKQVEQWAAFPRWPLDLSADFLADWAGSARNTTDGTPVLLTHDLDSPEGLSNLVRDFLPIEESTGARSCSFVVPHGWPLDDRALAEVRSRGHELGIHGYDHSNRSAFATPETRRYRLAAGKDLANRIGAAGYRAPSLLRTRELIDDLAPLYQYDSSIPTSGGLFPVPNNGCATARPFRLRGIVEIPLSMPRDGSLLFLGHSPEAIYRLWIECADRIASAGGVVVLLTHCEAHFSGRPAMLDTYRRFLDYLAGSGRFRFARTAGVLAEPGRAVPASTGRAS